MHPTRRHASGHKPRRGHYTSRCKHWSGLSQGHCRRKLTCLPPSEPCQHIARLGEATIPADANTGQAPDCAHKRGIRLQAQLRLAHGSLRDPTLTVLGAQGQKDSRRKHWICANLTKAAGHQMASTIKILRRKPLILRGKSHRSIGEFMGVNLWKHGQFWRVPADRICIASVPISATRDVGRKGDDAASRSDPTFTRASQGLRQ